MRRNPYAPQVPCHRVVASDRSLGGFNGQWGAGCERVQHKRQMLEQEGVRFTEDGRVSADCVLSAQQLVPLLGTNR